MGCSRGACDAVGWQAVAAAEAEAVQEKKVKKKKERKKKQVEEEKAQRPHACVHACCAGPAVCRR